MIRRAEIKMHDALAGWLTQDEKGYHFQYASDYVNTKDAQPVSLTLPIQETRFTIVGRWS